MASVWYLGYVLQPADDISRPEAVALTVPVVVLGFLLFTVALLVPHRRPWVRQAVLTGMALAFVSGSLMVLSLVVAMAWPRFLQFLFIDPNPVIGGMLIATALITFRWLRRPDVRAWYAR